VLTKCSTLDGYVNIAKILIYPIYNRESGIIFTVFDVASGSYAQFDAAKFFTLVFAFFLAVYIHVRCNMVMI
jgi:hypothetical protein